VIKTCLASNKEIQTNKNGFHTIIVKIYKLYTKELIYSLSIWPHNLPSAIVVRFTILHGVIHGCHQIHQGDMSSGQKTPNNLCESVSQGVDCVRIVSFMSTLLYDPMYTRYNWGRHVLEPAGVEPKSGN